MNDIFENPQEVYFSEKFNNLMIFTYETLFMLATVEGSNGRKILTSKEIAIEDYQLTYLGEL